jgi:hypothetical protein
VLTHSREHDAEEPAVAASGVSLKEMEIVLLAFDGAFGTGAGVFVEVPEVAVSGDERVEAIVLLGVGVDDAAVGRARTVRGEVRTGGEVWSLLGSGQGAAPFEAQAVGTEAPMLHGQANLADGDTFFQPQGTGVAQVILVALVERNDEGHVPALSGQTKETQGIVGRIQRSGLGAEAEDFPGAIESRKTMNTVMAVAIGQGDDEGQLTAMLEAVGSEFKEAMAVDPAFTVAVPAPQGVGVMVRA